MNRNGGKTLVIVKDDVNNAQLNGEWIFYTNQKEETLYKVDLNGNYKQKLSDDPVRMYYIKENWIYPIDYISAKLYKMKIDGSNKSLILKGHVRYQVIDSFIYYIDEDSKLYRINNDGSNKFLIPNIDIVQDFEVTEESIYFSNGSDDIYKINPDGSNPTLLYKDQPILGITYQNGYIYLLEQHESPHIFRLKADGTSKEPEMVN